MATKRFQFSLLEGAKAIEDAILSGKVVVGEMEIYESIFSYRGEGQKKQFLSNLGGQPIGTFTVRIVGVKENFSGTGQKAWKI